MLINYLLKRGDAIKANNKGDVITLEDKIHSLKDELYENNLCGIFLIF
jgi:hypothetical protein